MLKLLRVTVILVQIIFACYAEETEESNKFPDDFQFGAATAAQEIEGGWDVDGRSPNFWDNLAHTNPDLYFGTDNAYNVTEAEENSADSYLKWEDDIKAAKEIGLQFYRFSLSLTGLFPRGPNHLINEAGVIYYNNIINALIANNITPVITLIHYDSSQSVDHYFGGTSNELNIKVFRDFAEVAFNLFADRVTNWITFVSPYRYCKEIYAEFYGGHDPWFPSGEWEYYCGQNTLLSHAAIYDLYYSTYKDKVKNQTHSVGITLSFDWYEPASSNAEDREAAARAIDFELGWFAHPLVYGNYPERLINTVAKISQAQKYKESRLPSLSNERIELVKGKFDFLSISHLRTYLISNNETVTFPASVENDMQITRSVKDEWKQANNIFVDTPEGFYNAIKYVSDNYGKPNIHILHGYGALKDSVEDTDRISFLKIYLKQVLALISEGVKITQYDVWSLLDGFNFELAYKATFGLVQVKVDDPEKTRTLKASAKYYKNVIENHAI